MKISGSSMSQAVCPEEDGNIEIFWNKKINLGVPQSRPYVVAVASFVLASFPSAFRKAFSTRINIFL